MATDRPHAHLMRYHTDSTWLRTGEGSRIVLAGSPLRLFRLTEAGGLVADRIERGEYVERSTLIDRLVEAGALHPALHRQVPSQVAKWTNADVTVVTPQLGGTIADDGRITIDDGSTPPITRATVRLADNRGPAAARNAGRSLVETELIAFVDADVDVHADVHADVDVHVDVAGRHRAGTSWLDALLPHFHDPTVGLVAPRVLGGSRTSLDLGAEPARIRVGSRVGYVPAAAIVVRTAAFDDIGGFDERLRFGEDVDFVWRLDAAGWSCRYEPESQVWHAPRPTWAKRLRQQVGYGSSAAPLSLRHPAGLAPFRSNPWNAAVWVLGAFAHPVIGMACMIGGVASAVRKLPGVPASLTLRLALQAQFAAGRQLATAIRSVWWPILATLALVSHRARRVALAAALVDPGSVPTDLAYGWGVWRGMWELRTWTPIVPGSSGGLSATGPARRARSRRSERPGARGASPAATAR